MKLPPTGILLSADLVGVVPLDAQTSNTTYASVGVASRSLMSWSVLSVGVLTDRRYDQRRAPICECVPHSSSPRPRASSKPSVLRSIQISGGASASGVHHIRNGWRCPQRSGGEYEDVCAAVVRTGQHLEWLAAHLLAAAPHQSGRPA